MQKLIRRGLVGLAVLGAALVPLGAAEGGAFDGDNGPIAYTCGANICRINADGSGKVTLLTGATDPSWSSDESEIAFVDPANGVSVADADGTNPQGLGAGVTSSQPTFSEDGLRVAYTKTGDLWSSLADTHGQELHLTTGTAVDADPSYSPDGSEIAFARSTGGGYDIWTLDLTSSSLQQVTSAAGDERGPAWSPSGGSLVYTESANGHLFTVPSGGGTPADLNVVGSDPAYSPDGTKIAFIDASGHLASIPASVSASPTVTTIDSSSTFAEPDWQAVASTPPSSSGPPKNLSYPTINLQFGDSVPVVGHFLTASVGTWGGSAPLSYKYQWKRCNAADPVNGECVAIPGAISSFYTPGADDAGKRLRVQVTATNSQGTTSQNSEVSAVVNAVAPKLRSTPQIFGGNTVDTPLTLTAGTWDGSPPIRFTYSWRRCDPLGDLASCVEIPGATLATYTPTLQDIGVTIRVWITGTNPAGSDVAITNHTFPIVDKAHFAPSASSQPAVAGAAAIGRQLTADIGSYGGDVPLQTVLAWQRCDATGAACHPITSAGKKIVYFPTRQDVGSTIRVVVTTTNAYGSLVTKSDPTEAIAALPPHRRGRHIIGTAGADYKAGGGYDDVISGLAGNDTLLGGAGDDRIGGGPGNDVVFGGAGADRLYGGPGSDTIYASDGERDTVDCGTGRDRVVADSFDKVVNCEVVDSAAKTG